MILHPPAGSSLLVRGAADVVLALHIGGGCLGIASGAGALLLRKGGRAHRLAGNVFFASMLIMAVIGAVVSPMIHQPGNSMGGVFAFYLVVSGWLTVKRRPDVVGLMEVGAFFLPVAVAIAGLVFGLAAMNSPTGEIGGVPAAVPFIMGALAIFAVGLDVRVIARGGISGPSRPCPPFVAPVRRFVHGRCVPFPRPAEGLPPHFLRGAPIMFPAGDFVAWG